MENQLNRTIRILQGKYDEYPQLKAKIKGDAGIYRVWGVDWFNNKYLIERSCGNEWVSSSKVKLVPDA